MCEVMEKAVRDVSFFLIQQDRRAIIFLAVTERQECKVGWDLGHSIFRINSSGESVENTMM